MLKNTSFLFFCFFFVLNLSAQQAYFVDGYHGGIYGHYPAWQTQFMVDKLKQHPEWRISLEIEPETWDSVKANSGTAYLNLKNIVTDNKIEFTNPTYAQPYCFNISGESLIRQFEYGIKKVHHHFPDVEFTTYAVEEPCFTSSLPQILNLFGFKYAVLKNPDTCWGGYTRAYGGELINWIGSDGTSILTVPRYACEELEENSTWQTKAWNNSDSYLDACFAYGMKNPVGMCYQDAGWENGPWLGFGNRIKNNSIYVTWKDYIENVTEGKADDNWHLSQEDILVSLMWGSQVLQGIAQEVRVSENKVVMAEKIATMANIENQFELPQDKLYDAWRTLMMAQHHDSWIVPYNRLNKNRTWAEEVTLWTNNTNSISDQIMSDATLAESNNFTYIRIYNTLGIDRLEPVKINLPEEMLGWDIAVYNSDNNLTDSYLDVKGDSIQLVFNAKVPSFGFATYRVEKKERKQTGDSKPVSTNPNGEYVLENDMYRIIIDLQKGGIIKSLIAKEMNNREFLKENDQYGLGELRGFFYEEGKFYSSSDSPAKVTVLRDNPIVKSVKIEGEIASHPYMQIITITSGQKRIDFDLTIDWKGNVGIGEYKQGDNWRDNRRAFYDDRFKLNVLFPVDLYSPRLYKDAPFDVCESKLENTFFNTWDSIKHNIILHWVDLVQKDEKYGLALFSDHTTSYSYGNDFPLSLTAQYSGKGLWGPDYKITRPLKMKYAIMPHEGKWDKADVSVESNVLNEPLIIACRNNIELTDKSYIRFERTDYEITAFRPEGKDVVIRLYNPNGDDSSQNVIFNFPVDRIDEIDLRGKVIAKKKVNKALEENSITVSIPRFGIKTFRIKR